MAFNFSYSSVQYIGGRANQEDYCAFKYIEDKSTLCAVLADGMGGHASGEIASKVAVKAFIKDFSYLDASKSRLLLNLLNRANEKILNCINKNSNFKGMGCTLVAVCFSGNNFYWISVGDSPLYLFRERLIRLNEDHSMAGWVKESLEKKKITEEEAKYFPNKSALRSALTGDAIPLIDQSDKNLGLKLNDIIILASDGISVLDDIEIEKIISLNNQLHSKDIAEKLLEAVRKKALPNQDNLTIQVIKIQEKIQLNQSKNLLKAGFLIFLFFALIASTFLFNGG